MISNNYNIRTEPNQTHSEPNPSFSKTEPKQKNLFRATAHIPSMDYKVLT